MKRLANGRIRFGDCGELLKARRGERENEGKGGMQELGLDEIVVFDQIRFRGVIRGLSEELEMRRERQLLIVVEVDVVVAEEQLNGEVPAHGFLVHHQRADRMVLQQRDPHRHDGAAVAARLVLHLEVFW